MRTRAPALHTRRAVTPAHQPQTPRPETPAHASLPRPGYGHTLDLLIPQPKLRLSQPGDKGEREADRAADQVMRMTDPPVDEEEEEETIQTKAQPGQTPSISPAVESALGSPSGGYPLDSGVQGFMEPRFGADFSSVRVHADARAGQMSEDMQARAFTLGQDIYFAPGQYQPHSPQGRRLLAHELAHVVQQGSSLAAHSEGASIQRQETETEEESEEGLREQYSGQWDEARAALGTMHESLIERQKDAVRNFVQYASQEQSPPLSEQLLLTTINIILGAALGGLGHHLKSAITTAQTSAATLIIDEMVTASKKEVSTAVRDAWSIASSEGNALLQFGETQLLALEDLRVEQWNGALQEFARMLAAGETDEAWEAAETLYDAFQQNLNTAYNQQFNEMTDKWFTMQVQTIGPGARAGVLQIELESRYPDQGSFSIESGNLVGAGSVDEIRDRLARRDLEDITMPKVIQMSGYMGYGLLPCDWYLEVTGAEPPSSQPTVRAPQTTVQALTAGPQRVTQISGNRWGFPWLAAYHLGLNDLDRDDPRNNETNVRAGAREVWDAVKGFNPGSISNSNW